MVCVSFQSDFLMCLPLLHLPGWTLIDQTNPSSLLHSRDYWSGFHRGTTSNELFLHCGPYTNIRIFFSSHVLLLRLCCSSGSFDLCFVVHARNLSFTQLVNVDSSFCRWYSCMLGKKCSLAPLKEELRKQGVSINTQINLHPLKSMLVQEGAPSVLVW